MCRNAHECMCMWVDVDRRGHSGNYSENRHVARFTCVQACMRTHKHTHVHIHIPGYTHKTIHSSSIRKTIQLACHRGASTVKRHFNIDFLI